VLEKGHVARMEKNSHRIEVWKIEGNDLLAKSKLRWWNYIKIYVREQAYIYVVRRRLS